MRRNAKDSALLAIKPGQFVKRSRIVNELVAKFDVTKNTAGKWIDEGLPPPAVKLSGHGQYWHRRDVDAWLRRTGALKAA